MRQLRLGGRHQVRPSVPDQRPATGLHQHPGPAALNSSPVTVRLLLVRRPRPQCRRARHFRGLRQHRLHRV
ncbi:hypothetical protein ACFYNW_34390 [Streptomyces virginiae]|uniref:hypothetical protein n=1 Tax=Streptomyces virginiae TaxID=1961 RepID=UPI0036E2C19D